MHWPPDGADFVYDDFDFVVSNASLRSPACVARGLLAPFPPDQPERGLYRPLTHLSYAIDHALHEDEARGYHATNVALYLGIVLLVRQLALAYGLSPPVALATAALFGLHPVHSEAVDSITGRSELLALLAGIAALLLFLRALRGPGPSGRWLTAAALAQCLACLAKESAAALPGVLAVQAIVFAPTSPAAPADRVRRALRLLLPSLLALAAYLALRSAVLGTFSPTVTLLAGHAVPTRLATMGSVFFAYLGMLLLPARLEVDFYYQALIGIVERPTPASLLGWAAILGLGVHALRLAIRELAGRREREDARERRGAWLCGYAIFFAFLVPVSHVFPIGVLVAERLIFAPSLGFLLLAVLAAEGALARLPSPLLRSAVAAALIAVLAAAGALRSAARAADWRDPVRLWTATERALPQDARVPINLASIHLERGELPQAEAALGRALALAPRDRFARGNLAILRMSQDRLDEAEALFTELLAEEPRDALAWTSLARIEAARGHREAARAHLERALALAPLSEPARELLAELDQSAPPVSK